MLHHEELQETRQNRCVSRKCLSWLYLPVTLSLSHSLCALASLDSSILSFSKLLPQLPSPSYITPFLLARTWAGLDHVTRGRVAWNVVTSYSASAAKSMGKKGVMPSEERYKAAHEYMDLVYQSVSPNIIGSRICEPTLTIPECEKVARKMIPKSGALTWKWRFFQTHPSPQRTPVIFQAGASKSGIVFAGEHTEAIYTDYATLDSLKAYTKSVREAAIAAGRGPTAIGIFAAAVPIVGRTVGEAQAKYEKAKATISVQGAQWPMDQGFKFEGKAADNAITGVINGFKIAAEEDTEPWTPRYLGQMAGFGGVTPKPIGTAEMVADVFEKLFNDCDIDGFNIAYVSNPGSYEDVVELLVPELQKRGLMPGQPHLGKDHPGYQYKWNKNVTPVNGT
ncbi:uncharacterized protein PAC_04711 [Phialocephala subalpina]|uniref:Luciferase-like domain-containing protein n=1 Tax=Phialocephala subalpina TaxID=576137 RepID=A0A1L7WPY0_9HELO|nr:uncharacterized protein PAC_04711 [Phialocephala subalpina]